MIKFFWWLGFSGLTGLLYWLGGRFWGNKAIRRFGCPLVIYGYLWLLKPFSGLQGAILGLSAYILTAMALSTYWDSITRIWRGNEDEYWENWILTGFFYGLATFPLIWTSLHWQVIILRSIVLAITIMWLRERTGKVFWEEFGSGFLVSASIPLLLL